MRVCSARQELAPSKNTSPSRNSNTISSSSSPTRRPPLGPSSPIRNTPYSPRSGMVPALVTASRKANERARTVPLTRSQTSRGRRSGNSSAGIASRQHIEHTVEGRARQLGERRGLSHQAIQSVYLVRLDRAHGDQLLGEHVERVSRIKRGLDAARKHAARGGRGGWQIGLVLRHQHALGRAADVVLRATDSLQARSDRRRGFDLHDQIDGADVEPELERRGSDDRRH